MYKLKQLPEDFFVEELYSYNLEDNGDYRIYRLKKKGMNTIDAVGIIAKELGIRQKDIGYAGLKDKNAVTIQNISIFNSSKFDDNYQISENLSLELLGYRKDRLFPGFLDGNRFRIVVRNIFQKPKRKKDIINYFGEQRFSKKNDGIGKLIIQKKFMEAVNEIKSVEKGKTIDLIESEKNPVNALQRMDKRIIRIYLHAYQSKLWNMCADKFIEKGYAESIQNPKIPIPGFGTEFSDKKIEECMAEVLDKEGINLRDFIVRQLNNLSVEGGERDLFVKLEELKIEDLDEDELNQEMKKYEIMFSLPKGAYATEAVKQLVY